MTPSTPGCGQNVTTKPLSTTLRRGHTLGKSGGEKLESGSVSELIVTSELISW